MKILTLNCGSSSVKYATDIGKKEEERRNKEWLVLLAMVYTYQILG
jgi:acetate kinase